HGLGIVAPALRGGARELDQQLAHLLEALEPELAVPVDRISRTVEGGGGALGGAVLASTDSRHAARWTHLVAEVVDDALEALPALLDRLVGAGGAESLLTALEDPGGQLPQDGGCLALALVAL